MRVRRVPRQVGRGPERRVTFAGQLQLHRHAFAGASRLRRDPPLQPEPDPTAPMNSAGRPSAGSGRTTSVSARLASKPLLLAEELERYGVL
jgi:hypothetical protein